MEDAVGVNPVDGVLEPEGVGPKVGVTGEVARPVEVPFVSKRRNPKEQHKVRRSPSEKAP